MSAEIINFLQRKREIEWRRKNNRVVILFPVDRIVARTEEKKEEKIEPENPEL